MGLFGSGKNHLFNNLFTLKNYLFCFSFFFNGKAFLLTLIVIPHLASLISSNWFLRSKVAPSTPRRKVGTSRSSHDPRKRRNSREPVIKYQSDTKLLGEMIFGTMSMVYHGVTLKIHPNVGSDSRRPHTMISYLSQFNLEVLSKQASVVLSRQN